MKNILREIKGCTVCAKHLPYAPKPIVQAGECSKILIIGQAPGQKVQDSGIPWDDASGNNLRKWLGVDKDLFYDDNYFALIPMGFCYPGKGRSGDLPPRTECAPLWHSILMKAMKDIRLTLLVGQYAQRYYLKDKAKATLTATVENYVAYLPGFLPLPHPSPRNNIWLKKNEWFEKEVLPILQATIRQALSNTSHHHCRVPQQTKDKQFKRPDMRKVIAGINMTLDGICDHTAIIPDEELHQHYADLLSNSGTVLYGRITYQLMEYWKTVAENPTGDQAKDEFAMIMDKIPKIVFSHTLKNIEWESAKLADRDLENEVLALKQQSGKDILVGCRSLIIQLMELNLIDEFQLCIHPVLAAEGLPLFDKMTNRTVFKLSKTKILGSGAVVLYYEPIRP